MAFKRFIKTGRLPGPMASIWKRGQIGINKGAVERFGLQDYKFVVLFYDRERACIGMNFTNDENEAGAMSLSQGQTGAVISAKNFLDFYEIPYGDTERFPLTYDEEHKLYIIQLSQETADAERATELLQQPSGSHGRDG